ncbi:MAG: T9SS type A sorting domain-containing protein [Candidatus Cloacimonetes bacterium]|nr:T9SS type A sorting domain-containing protein [Candidatus Cloacimonadota bacterium]
MKLLAGFILIYSFLSCSLFAQVNGDYQTRTNVTGNWNATNVWQKYNNGWANVSTNPTSADGAINIRSGATITVSANVTADQLTVNGTLNINSSRTLSIANGAGTDMLVNGTLGIDGSVSVTGSVDVAGTIRCKSGSEGVISGTGSFTLSSGASFYTTNVNGIYNAPTNTGSVQTSTRSYSSGASYYYNSAENSQSTGPGIPSTVYKLGVECPQGLSISKDLTVTDELAFLYDGILNFNNTYNMTLDTECEVTGFIHLIYDSSGKIFDLPYCDILQLYNSSPDEVPAEIGEVILQNSSILPNDVTVTTLTCNGYGLDLDNKILTLKDKDFEIEGNSTLSDLSVELTNNVNYYGSSNSIAHTWTTYGTVSDPVSIRLFYPESETSAPQVRVWTRVPSGTGNWVFVGEYNTFGTDPKYITVNNISDLGSIEELKDWTISDTDQTLPVELTAFYLTVTPQNFVSINWVTQSETGVLGYYVYRNFEQDFNTAIKFNSLIQANNTTQELNYIFIDQNAPMGVNLYYWLQSIDYNNSTEVYGPVVITLSDSNPPNPVLPLRNYINVFPNPFSSATNISFGITKDSQVQIVIYNSKGAVVRNLYSASKKAGTHTTSWNGADNIGKALPSGMYFIRMTAGKDSSKQKVILIK